MVIGVKSSTANPKLSTGTGVRANSQEHLGEYSEDVLMVPGGFYAVEEYMLTE